MRVLRQAVRSLLRSRAFTATAVATVAVVIAINAAVFSILHAVVLSPLPYRDPDRLVAVWQILEGENGKSLRPAPAAFVAWRKWKGPFSEIASFNGSRATLTGAGAAEPVALEGSRVSDNYFGVLGIAPILGRTFRPDDAFPESEPIVLLSDRLWRERFSSDPAVLGRSVVLNGVSRRVAGVMPTRFLPFAAEATGKMNFHSAPAFWIPAPFSGAAGSQNLSHVLGVAARLAPGVDRARAEREVAAFEKHRASEGGRGTGARVRPLVDEAEGSVRPALVLVWGAVLFVLLIACVNVANLHFARSESRRREVAIRTALGGSRAALVRQLLFESLLLALAGGAAGLLLAYWALPLLLQLVPEGVPRLGEVSLSPSVAGFALVLSVATAVLFGLGPALHLTAGGRALEEDLRESTRGSGSGSRRTRKTLAALVLAEVALASLLVVGAGLLTRSFGRLVGVDLGFRPERILVVPFSLPKSSYGTAGRVGAFQDALLARVRSTPGVASASFAYNHPLEAQWGGVPTIAGRPLAPSEAEHSSWFRSVGDGYFATTGEAIRAGREFDARDDLSHPGVAIVNEAFARREFPGESPLGKRLDSHDGSYWWGTGAGVPEQFEIVGIAADVRFLGRDKAPEPAYYLPARQFPIPDMKILVRARGTDPLALLPAVRAAIRSLDPAQPIGAPTTIAALLDESVAQPRFAMRLMLAFAGAGLALAALGIYGLLTFIVTLRTREIGVRMALGARTRDIVRIVVGEAGPLAAIGALVGAALSLAVTPVLRSLLFGVSPADPVSILAAPAVLAAVAAAASLLPARRAARVDPSVSLRSE